MIGLPVGLAVYLTRRFKLGWRLWWIGAAVFILSQVGHIPFNSWFFGLFEKGILQLPSPAWKLPVYAILGGLSAGLWEELSRYAMYRWWAKSARSWKEGILAGAGHGGSEAIILGLLVLWTFIQLAALLGKDLSGIVPAEKVGNLQQTITTYWSAPWTETLLGAVERAFTIPFHIAASLLVLQAFTRNKIYWLGLAIAWHTLIDAAIPGYIWPRLQSFPWGPYVVELVLGLVALVNIGIIFALRQPDQADVTHPEPPLPDLIIPSPLPEIEVTSENLDKTRYNP